MNPAIEFIKIPEAKTYRQTLVLKTQAAGSSSQVPVPQQLAYEVYVLDNGIQEGPYSFDVINQRIGAGQINAATAMLWYKDLAEWTPISKMQG